MGRSNIYKCEKCENQLYASLNDTRGIHCEVLAVKCLDCNEVTDSAIRGNNRYTKENVRDPEFVECKPACLKCRSFNVVKWDVKCPKCNGNMIDKGVAILWD